MIPSKARQGWHRCSPTIPQRTKPRSGRHRIVWREYAAGLPRRSGAKAGAGDCLRTEFYKYAAPLALGNGGNAAVNAPQSRRSARLAGVRQARSVWSAGGFSTAFGPDEISTPLVSPNNNRSGRRLGTKLGWTKRGGGA